jgi:hypothetical protein
MTLPLHSVVGNQWTCMICDSIKEVKQAVRCSAKGIAMLQTQPLPCLARDLGRHLG